jgi:hypothetical protein
LASRPSGDGNITLIIRKRSRPASLRDLELAIQEGDTVERYSISNRLPVRAGLRRHPTTALRLSGALPIGETAFASRSLNHVPAKSVDEATGGKCLRGFRLHHQKDRPAALANVKDFVERAKANGNVRRAFDDAGLNRLPVAP